MTRFLLMTLAAVVLTACQDETAEAETMPIPTPPEMACGTEIIEPLIGQPQSALETVELPELYRVIGPDMAVTMDHRPNRLNILIDEDGVILSAACG